MKTQKFISFGQIDCPQHGYQSITEQYYDQQMIRANQPWRCPICARSSEWIDQDDMEDSWNEGPPF